VLRDILPEADGGVWVASYGGGLGYLKDGVGRTVSRMHGLPDNSLTAIRSDVGGNLWILSNLGLVVAPRAELLAVATGSASKFAPVVLGPEAGMPESEFGEPSAMTDAQGRLWFGTIAGPVRVDPRDFPFNRTPARVSIERVRADDVALPLSARVEVPALTRRLELGFTAFALTAPERTCFRYQLEGFDEHWIEAGAQRWVAFTSLSPGPYHFRVAARNEDGLWSESPALLDLYVLPAWWQTWTFRGSAVLAAAVLLLLVHRLRVDVVRRRGEALLEATEGRAQAEERESRLRDQLAHAGRVATAGELASSLAHEVNQPLAAIVTNAQAGQRFLAREPFARSELDDVLGDIAQQGQRASAVIRRLREFLRKHQAQRSEVDLNAVLRDTLPLLRREIEDHGVQTVLALQESLPAIRADPVQLQQVLVNLIKNSCEALAGAAGPRTIEIRSRSYDGRVLMEVCDNGPGLVPEVSGRLFQPYVTTKPDGMGLGLAICRSIVEAHGGSLAADARLGGGVIFHIELPGLAGAES
jgi:signal transduction histidine kinase